MLDVSAFSFQPRRLWRVICVSASIDDPGDIIAKFLPDIAQSFRATAIFHRIVKKRANRFGFIRAVLKRDGSHAKNMADERNSRFLARLITMQARRINQRLLKLFRHLQLNIIAQFTDTVRGFDCLTSELDFRRSPRRISDWAFLLSPRSEMSSLRVRFIEPVLVSVFEGQIPI